MTKYGETTWDEPIRSNKSRKTYDKEKFITLEEGINTVRLVTNPFRYLTHKVTFEGDDNQYGRNIRCATEGCPLCAQDSPAKDKFVVGAINRKNGEAKFLEFGPQIYQSINTIRQLKDYKDVKDFDINIIKNNKATPVYTVVPGAISPLSVDDIEKADKINIDDLNAYIQPISPDEVTNSIERIQKWIAKNADGKKQNSGQQKNNTQKTIQKAVQKQPEPQKEEESTNVNEADFEFKSMKK